MQGQFADFFDNAAVGLHWVGADGTILRANRAELEMLGFEAHEYVGRNIADFHADADVIRDILRRLSSGEQLRDHPARLRCKDGSIKHVAISSNVLREEGRFVHTRCVTVDVTGRRLAEEALREREVWLSGQGAALEAALNGEPLAASLGILARTVADLLGPDVRAAFYLANPAGTALHHVVGMNPAYAQAVDGFPIGPESLSCGLAAHLGEPILTTDVMAEPLWASWRWLAREHGFRGCWSVPIHTSARKFAGTLAVYWREARAASTRDIDLISRAGQAASIIVARHQEAQDRQRAQEAERRQAERLAWLLEAAATLLGADDPDVMLRGLLARIGPQLGVDAYFNYLVDESGNGLRLASYRGIPADTARSIGRLALGEAICGMVAQHGEPFAATTVQESADPRVRLVKSLGMRSYACHPLVANGRVIGTLSFGSRTKDRFDPDEISFLETICQYVTVSYERLRLLHELKEGDRRKDEFLATLAHELRNPLAPVRNAVQILRLKGSDLPELRWSREVISRQVDHLTRLIDDLLDISRITRNKLELRRQRVELAEVVNAAVEASRPLIEQYGHQLAVHLPAEAVCFDGDVVRLAQVFLNLLNNAAKYTEPGGTISLTAERRGSEAVVCVKDSGVGIAPENIARLFQIFFQADRSLEKSRGGLGIGLSLVRRLVELHDGTVEARSEGIGRGSEFIVRLPVLAVMPLALSPGTGPAVSPASAQRVLVVDDNRDAADSLAILLRIGGTEVHVAYDGRSAVEAFDRSRPDVVLLDIGMPGMNGYETCRAIRTRAGAAGVAIIATTGWGEEAYRNRSAEAGFDGHLIKPVDVSALNELLASVRGAGEAPRAVSGGPPRG